MTITKHSIPVVVDRQLYELDRADAQRIRAGIFRMFVEDLELVQEIAARHADGPSS